MRKSYDFHVRITEEEYTFLKNMNINKSKLVRDAIYRKMQELPEVLEKRREELLRELRIVEEKLENINAKNDSEIKYLDFIAGEFQKFHREKYDDAQNIEWLESRYKERLDSRNILIPIEGILKYCIEKARVKNECE